MISYLIKSTICLFTLYGFFHLFLRNHKTLQFNRFYLISSLIFSLIIPLVIIPVKSSFTLSSSIDKIALLQNQSLKGDQIPIISNSQYSHPSIFAVIFILISSILLMRFILNIFRIIIKAYKCKRIQNANITLVLVNEKTLPYSFFKYLFVNKSDFENDKIEKELLRHEEAHCFQFHSADIILLEVITVIFWFNPAIWLFKKAILLNHEYYADNKVLSYNDTYNYQDLLVNLVIQNNTSSLVSNFKYSLIKNRLIMMTNDKPIHNMILKKSSAVILLLSLAVIISCKQETNPTLKALSNSVDTLKPIIYHVDSLGSQNNNIRILNGNVIIRIPEFNNSYSLIKSQSATYDQEKKIITALNGTWEAYNSGDPKPYNSFSFEEIKYDLASHKGTLKNINGVTRQVTNKRDN